MRLPLKMRMGKWFVVLCLGLLPGRNEAAQFVELSAEIETFGYRLADTNSIARARPKTVHVFCITGGEQWFIEEDFQGKREWLFNGTEVLRRSGDLGKGKPAAISGAWKARDAHPMGDIGVNMPWLAFCSGAYLKGERRIIPLPAAPLQHCPDRFAYSDVTTTFDDGFGLPKTLDLFTSSALFLKSHTEWDEEQSFGDRYTQWNKSTSLRIQDGVLIFHYGVLVSTNVLGRSFPLRFSFFQTGRQYEQDGNWCCQGTGRVTSIGRSTQSPIARWSFGD